MESTPPWQTGHEVENSVEEGKEAITDDSVLLHPPCFSEANALSDVTFMTKSEGKEERTRIHYFRLILCLQSTVFNVMLTDTSDQAQQGLGSRVLAEEISLEDPTEDVRYFFWLLQHVTTHFSPRNFPFSKRNVVILTRMCFKYDAARCLGMCEDYLRRIDVTSLTERELLTLAKTCHRAKLCVKPLFQRFLQCSTPTLCSLSCLPGVMQELARRLRTPEMNADLLGAIVAASQLNPAFLKEYLSMCQFHTVKSVKLSPEVFETPCKLGYYSINIGRCKAHNNACFTCKACHRPYLTMRWVRCSLCQLA